ncbi:MAG: large subunit ribosomal protein L15 [Parcubacteria group bacterium Gr01-1014_19]|nr:MAG: large subunit ribosomal protein L15 [Parcubacteria group bacterium Gr01-1014_19]
MNLSQLKPNTPRKYSKPRVGRGGKRGTMSGKGQKGQKSRSGRRMRPAERDLIQRLPKLRGTKNKPLEAALPVLNLKDLERVAQSGVVSEKILGRKVKILGDGEIKKPVTIEGLPVSKSAKEKIEAAGGKIVAAVKAIKAAKVIGATKTVKAEKAEAK